MRSSFDTVALLTRRRTSDSSSPWLGVPLPRPDSLRPIVTREQKEQVLLKYDPKSKAFLSEGGESAAAVVDDVAAQARRGFGRNID